VLLVGLTGGIGSGKSTVARMLEQRGAVVVDADDLARLAVTPGTPTLGKIRDEFGPGVVTGRGQLDRKAMAARIFGDPAARRALEAIVHPEVARRFAEALEPHRGTDRVVVYAVPLLAERRLEGMFDVVVTVSAPEPVRVARMVSDRGMDEGDVRRRLAAQATDEDRERVAHLVISNDGSHQDLELRVDGLWAALRERATAAR